MPYVLWEHFFHQWDFLKSDKKVSAFRSSRSLHLLSPAEEFRKFQAYAFGSSVFSSESPDKDKWISIYIREGDFAFRRAEAAEEMINGNRAKYQVHRQKFEEIKDTLEQLLQEKNIELENVSRHLDELSFTLEQRSNLVALAKMFSTQFGVEEEEQDELLLSLEKFIIQRAADEMLRKKGEPVRFSFYIDPTSFYVKEYVEVYKNKNIPLRPFPTSEEVIGKRWLNPFYLLNAAVEGSSRLANGLGNYCFQTVGAISEGVQRLANYFSNSNLLIKGMSSVFIGIPVGIVAGVSTLFAGTVGISFKLAAFGLAGLNVATSAVAKILSVSGIVEAYNRIKYGHSRLSSTRYTVEHKKEPLRGRKSTKDLLGATTKKKLEPSHIIELAPRQTRAQTSNQAGPISQPSSTPINDRSDTAIRRGSR